MEKKQNEKNINLIDNIQEEDDNKQDDNNLGINKVDSIDILDLKLKALLNDEELIDDQTDKKKDKKNKKDKKDKNEERLALIKKEDKKEKKDLLEIIKRLKEDLESEEFDTLDEIYGQYLNNEDMTKRKIKPNTNRCSLIFMFYIISPIFGIINLIGIFESITMMNIIFQILKNAAIAYFESIRKDKTDIKLFSLEDFNNNYNFYNMFFESTKKESFDFNLMMFTGFLGDILLKSRGFRISTFIFAIINGISIFLIISFSFFDYDSKDNTYTLLRILYLLLCWLLLLIGVGASSLLSQQVIVDSNAKYSEYIKKLDEKAGEKWEKMKEQWKSNIKQDKENKKKKEEGKENNKEKELNIIDDTEKNDEFNDNLDIIEEEKDNINEIELIENDGKEEDALISKTKSEEKNNIIIDNNNKDEMSEKFNKIYNAFKGNKKKPKFYRRAITVNDHSQKLANKKNMNQEKKETKQENNKFNSFFMICITTIFGYFLKYIINYVITEKYETNLDEYMNISGCGNDDNCYDKIYTDKNLTNSNSPLFEQLKKQYQEDGYDLFFIIIIIYVGCMGISIFLYSIFVCIFTKNQKEKNVAGNNYRVCKICGYTIYKEDMILNKEPPCCEFCKLICSTTKNCIKMVSQTLNQNLCDICGLCICFNQTLCPKDNDSDSDDENNNCCCCFSCCKCEEYDIKDYKKNTELFCYCYQTKRKQSWFKKYVISDIQKSIFPYMVEYFILQLSTIAFEKQYLNYDYKSEKPFSSSTSLNSMNDTGYYETNNFSNETNRNTIIFIENQNIIFNLQINDLYTFLTFIGTFFLFFYLTLSLNNLNTWKNDDEDEEDEENEEKEENKENNNKSSNKNINKFGVVKLSNGILNGAFVLILFDGLFATIFSLLYLLDSTYIIFTNINFFMVPILINKFYHFTLIYYCISYSEAKKQYDLISGSTLISFYLFVWETIISLIRDYLPLNILYIIQVIIGVFPSLYIVMLIIAFFYLSMNPKRSCSFNMSNLCCYFSFIFLLGGFWCNNKIYSNSGECISGAICCSSDYTCDCDCCDLNCYCCFDFLNFFKCFDCCGSYCCSCCECWDCYDCFGCCSCFYCCGDTCGCNIYDCEDCLNCFCYFLTFKYIWACECC